MACAQPARPLAGAAREYAPRSTAPARHRGGHLRAQTVPTWSARHLLVRLRLAHVGTRSLFGLDHGIGHFMLV